MRLKDLMLQKKSARFFFFFFILAPVKKEILVKTRCNINTIHILAHLRVLFFIILKCVKKLLYLGKSLQHMTLKIISNNEKPYPIEIPSVRMRVGNLSRMWHFNTACNFLTCFIVCEQVYQNF